MSRYDPGRSTKKANSPVNERKLQQYRTRKYDSAKTLREVDEDTDDHWKEFLTYLQDQESWFWERLSYCAYGEDEDIHSFNWRKQFSEFPTTLVGSLTRLEVHLYSSSESESEAIHSEARKADSSDLRPLEQILLEVRRHELSKPFDFNELSPKSIEAVKAWWHSEDWLRYEPYSLVLILALHSFWCNRPEDCTVRDKRGIFEFLFSRYSVPKWLVDVAMDERRSGTEPIARSLCWFLQMAQGCSLFRLGKLHGWYIPASMQKHLFSVPDDLPLEQEGPFLKPTLNFERGLLYAEVLRLGGNDIDARRILGDPSYVIDICHPGDIRSYEEYVREVTYLRDSVSWLIRFRDEIDDAQAATFLAWGRHRMIESIRRGEKQFSWKHRTPKAVNREVIRQQRLEDRLRVEREQQHNANLASMRWKSHCWDWRYTDEQEQIWEFREILSTAELWDEGRTLRHCVGSYARRCVTNVAAVFSLRLNGEQAITIEVETSTRTVLQSRGLLNRPSSRQEHQIIQLWLRSIVNGANHRETPNPFPAQESLE